VTTRLRVAIDGRRLTGGVGRIVRGVLPHLARSADVTLLTDPRSPTPDVEADVREVALGVPAGLPQLGWLELAVGGWLRRHPQLFHGAFNAVPLRWRGPSVVSIYDLSFELHPVDFGPVQRRAWQRYARHAARRSGHVLTASAFTASQLRSTYDLADDRITVVPTGLAGGFEPGRAAGLPAVLEATGLRTPYVVALGGAPRRRLGTAVAAWRRAVALGHDVDLAVVGPEVPPQEARVVALGAIDDATWATVLAGADAFLYATTYEGFGFPAQEAMASGTPVVCARVCSLPEVLGDAGAWAPAASAEALGDALAALLADPARREALARAGLARAASTPSWSDAAEVVLETYRRVAAS
jgi:alpha-1,3-rhamnosyl/mannosyltransferase